MGPGIPSPSIKPTQFPSLPLVRLQKKGIATPQEEGELRAGGLVGELIANVIWVGNIKPNSQQRMDRYDPLNVEMRRDRIPIGFPIRSYCIDSNQRVYVFGGPVDPMDEDTLHFGAILDACSGAVIRRFFLEGFGVAKSCATSMMRRHVLIALQSPNEMHLLDMGAFEDEPDTVTVIRAKDRVFNVWKAETAMDPRGLIQSGRSPYNVWVASKGGNLISENQPSHIERFANPVPGVYDAKSNYRSTIPFGGRGVCIDPDPSLGHDEIWVCALGENSAQRNPGEAEANGQEVIRIRDFNTGPPELTRIILPGGIGPISITASVFGDKYVVCAQANEIWKIPKNVDELLAGAPVFRDPNPLPDPTVLPVGLIPPNRLPRGAVPGWPIRVGGGFMDMNGIQLEEDPGPLSISIDGNGAIWVLFKLSRHVMRIKDPRTGPPTPDDINVINAPNIAIGFGSPETLGDFTGYHTAANLFPMDNSNNLDGTNILDLDSTTDPKNPFFDPPMECPPPS